MKRHPWAGKVDAKVLLLTAGLGVALLAVWMSWRLSHPPVRTVTPPSRVEMAGQRADEVERLIKSVQAHLQGSAEPIATNWPSVTMPEFKAVARPVAGEQSLRLSGIARNGAQPMAFINDHTYGVGETVEGYTLMEIENEQVTLVDARGRKVVLPLYEKP